MRFILIFDNNFKQDNHAKEPHVKNQELETFIELKEPCNNNNNNNNNNKKFRIAKPKRIWIRYKKWEEDLDLGFDNKEKFLPNNNNNHAKKKKNLKDCN